MRKSLIAVALLMSSAASGAHAAVLDFAYSTVLGTPITAAFQITIADTQNSLGGYTIQSVSGKVDGSSVSLTPYTQTFPVSSVGTYVFNDTIYKLNSSYILSVSGMLVETATSYYKFGESGLLDYALKSSSTTTLLPRVSTGRYTLTLAQIPAPVPEPATWALMVGGFGLLGATMRGVRTRRSVARA